ncbi:MAG: glycoside hydrolase family 99-like domain-containing protein [Coriobacteriales bacterium]
MKVLGLYLPAFHRIPENDEWWGAGFTEWDNVRSGKSYYTGHIQPVEPLNDWYYDLSKAEDIKRQSELARCYGVNGFVSYHYWFGNGRMIFERPMEILHDNNDIEIEYCFCWANDTWKTTWHGKDPKELIRQEYPGPDDWKQHIEYLLPFFRDKRYIKKNNRPVFFFYKAAEIPDYERMLDYWDGILRSAGFEGLFAVEYISSKNTRLYSLRSNAVFEFEPLYTTFFDLTKVELVKRAFAKISHSIDYQSYDKLWGHILSRSRTYCGKEIIRSCFSGWDNSPRKERDSMIVRGSSPEKFERYFSQLLESKRQDYSDDFCVINAWNEWSEGAYLEPDKHNGLGYLISLRNAINEVRHA